MASRLPGGERAVLSRRAERALFIRSFLANPRQVGAVLPTSLRAVRSMLDMAPVGEARTVAELGAGTGVYTHEILARMPADGSLLAFELDHNLADGLRRDVTDPRLRVLAESAEGLPARLEGAKADLIVSGLPFTSLPKATGGRILDAAREALAPDGTMLVLQYSPFVQGELRKRFGSVRRRVSPLNLPPAVLFACTGAAPTGGRSPS